MMAFRSLALIVAIGMVGVFPSAGVAQSDEGTARAEIAKWAGSDDTDAFLRQPAVRAELQKLLGPELKHLLHNLNVRGSVELIGWTLTVSGNAPHQGTEEEAIMCVVPGTSMVEAAILSAGTVTVYTRAEQYEYTNRCIKDWITLANSGHADRMQQPANVRVVPPAR
ncbi:MAG: hypothetical protein Q8L74_01740 [Nitrospirota bacterium]|nr:hypothetical protein [Nitrospirota bacterium]MDP2383585.1 hypothetical protein [Nitrospirota bacterium]MDP3595874.1 hypothetical protein [Nitrospirota bacterium]